MGETARDGMVKLSFWDCGHVEVDDGSEHRCDDRPICTATIHRFVALSFADARTLEAAYFDGDPTALNDVEPIIRRMIEGVPPVQEARDE